jgi:hypothetical protein
VVQNSTYDYKILLNKASLYVQAGPVVPMTISISWIVMFVKQVLGTFVGGIVLCNYKCSPSSHVKYETMYI